MAIPTDGLELFAAENAKGRPVAGQSLTNSPEQPYKWEQPPEFTTVNEANLFILQSLIEEKTYTNLVLSVADGVPVADVASVVLYHGFTQGKWNPDLMLLLMESVMYMIIGLVEKAGIFNYKLYSGESEDDKNDVDPDIQIKTLQRAVGAFNREQVAQTIDPRIEELLETVEPPPSLLEARPEEAGEEAVEPTSLLGRQEMRA
tara:strand:+ start:1076 stop:1684 length:609 start_codon:yes stop_codon:yes gene_type:complete